MIDDPDGPGTIRVCPGTYGGNFTIRRTVTLIGAGQGEDPAANTILQGTGAIAVVFISGISGGFIEVTLRHLRITGGGGVNGGGIFNSLEATLTLIASTVIGNTVSSVGGGIINNHGTLTLITSTVTGNRSADDGGGIYNAGDVSIDGESRVTRNTATAEGGGIYNYGGAVTLANDQIVTDNCPNNCDGPTPVANCAAAPVSCPPPP